MSNEADMLSKKLFYIVLGGTVVFASIVFVFIH
jgi:hypothetical protein